MTDIKERLRIVSQSPRSFDTALLKDALGEIERLEARANRYVFLRNYLMSDDESLDDMLIAACDHKSSIEEFDDVVRLIVAASQKEPT